jgi:hypothetical protein
MSRPATRATLHKQIDMPLPEVKAATSPDDDTVDVPNMRGPGQQGRTGKPAGSLVESERESGDLQGREFGFRYA